MAVTDFETKVAVIVRGDLAGWQRLNVCAFLISGVTAAAGPGAIGEDYLDADDNRYLPLLVQPVLIFEATADKLTTVRERAERREVPIALYTMEMFSTGHDAANRAAVRAVAAADLDVVGIALRAPHRDADAVLRASVVTRNPGRASRRQPPIDPVRVVTSCRSMRLIVARCSARYTGRLTTHLPEATRLLMVKADGTFMVWADGGGSSVKPLNWMTPPTAIEEADAEDGTRRIVVRKRAGSSEDRLEIVLSEVLSDSEHDMGSPDEHAGLTKDGVEADLQELLAEQPDWCGEGFRLVRREWPTDIGPVDLMCRDHDGGWIAVEIKRVAGIEAVEQLTRYLERIRLDPAFADCRGVLSAQTIKPQARVLAQARGIECVEVDLAVLRGEREPDLKLFAA